MDRELTHVELGELLGVYALDAVDGDEKEALERHLPKCPRCRAELTRHQEVAALLAHQGVRAPEGVWERIVSSLEEEPPQLDLSRVEADLQLLQSRRSRPAAFERASERWSRRPWWGRLVPAVAAVLIGILGVHALEQRHRLNEQGRQLNEALSAMERVGIQEAALAAMNSPSARLHNLRSADGRLQVKTVLLPGGQGYLIDNNLPQLPEGRTYQLWQETSGVKISIGVLGRELNVVPFQVAPDASALAITAEQAPGVVSSSRLPVAASTI